MSLLVPMVLVREGNSERAMDLRSRLLSDRIIKVEGPIESTMAGIIKDELLFLEAENPRADIYMYIDSPGGEMYSGLSIIDMMNYVTPDIVTINNGLAASMASMILAAGTKGKRFSLPRATVMIHQPSSGAQGKISDIEIAYKESQRLKEDAHQLMADCTGKSIEQIKADMDRDNWLSAEEAKAYGIIDDIIVKHSI